MQHPPPATDRRKVGNNKFRPSPREPGQSRRYPITKDDIEASCEVGTELGVAAEDRPNCIPAGRRNGMAPPGGVPRPAAGPHTHPRNTPVKPLRPARSASLVSGDRSQSYRVRSARQDVSFSLLRVWREKQQAPVVERGTVAAARGGAHIIDAVRGGMACMKVTQQRLRAI